MATLGLCSLRFIRMIVMIVAAVLIVPCSGANTHIVGDNYGWQTPNTGFNYTNWAARHSFLPGDILVFNFTTGQHTAAKVRESDYASCNTANPLTVEVNGPANYTLTAGTSYFMCTKIGHCGQGQKLAVIVASSTTGSPASSPSFPPPPSSSAVPTAVASSLMFFIIFITLIGS